MASGSLSIKRKGWKQWGLALPYTPIFLLASGLSTQLGMGMETGPGPKMGQKWTKNGVNNYGDFWAKYATILIQ